jgi:S-adenosylmethionine:tRNA ribosyltransferase-isomerase
LVLNDTKVIPARLYGRRSGGGQVEVLLIAEEDRNRWWALVKPGRGLPVGRRLSFEDGVGAEVLDCGEGGRRLLQFDGVEDIFALLPCIGEMPLPPYIKRGDRSQERVHDRALDAERYQTVYAKDAGAIAAPTAGLHFTERVLTAMERHGVEIAFLTLHVGVGTFKPVTVDRVTEHRMGPERYIIPEKTATAIKRAKAEGRRVGYGLSLHHPRPPFSGGGYAPDQLSPSPVHAAHPRVCLCRKGSDSQSVCRCDAEAVSVLQLR